MSRVSRAIRRCLTDVRCSKVRILCRRSANLIIMTRISSATESSILRKLTACLSSSLRNLISDNFVTPSTNCTDCHIHWEVDVFDHSVTGLALNDDHIEEDCEVCHIDRDFRVEPTCDNCHDGISYPRDLPGAKK